MKKIHIISSGGNFNKVFDRKKDTFVVEKRSKALKEIEKKGFCNFEITNIGDRADIKLLENAINSSKNDYILIVCDMSDIGSIVKDINVKEKYIVFMDTDIPYQVDPVGATSILCSVYGQMIMMQEKGLHIVEDGLIIKS